MWAGDTEHAPINLGVPTNNSPAVKVLPYQIAENEQCFIGYQANELSWGGTVIPNITMASQPIGIGRGERFYMTAPEMNGWFVRVTTAAGTNSFQSYFDAGTYWCDADGNVYSGSTLTFKKVSASADWADDAKIKVTADGSDTFVDLNGNTNLSVSHKTTMPTGWTKNRARIGEQVEGVDL